MYNVDHPQLYCNFMWATVCNGECPCMTNNQANATSRHIMVSWGVFSLIVFSSNNRTNTLLPTIKKFELLQPNGMPNNLMISLLLCSRLPKKWWLIRKTICRCWSKFSSDTSDKTTYTLTISCFHPSLLANEGFAVG